MQTKKVKPNMIRNILKEKILYWLLIANYRKSLYVENSFPINTLQSLEAMGYKINKREAIGRTELIVINYKPIRQITAIADIRGDDDAAGY